MCTDVPTISTLSSSSSSSSVFLINSSHKTTRRMIQFFLVTSLITSARSFSGINSHTNNHIPSSVASSAPNSRRQEWAPASASSHHHYRSVSVLSSTIPPIRSRTRSASSSSSSSLWTTSTSTAAADGGPTDTTSNDDDDGYDAFETANRIEPQTKPLTESMLFYARFLVNYFIKQHPHPMLTAATTATTATTTTTTTSTTSAAAEARGGRRAMWKKLNEQRRNVVTLAGYTRDIVAPSFGFLMLGALMSSIVPAYWGKCIQIVATLTATRAELLEAVIGLGVTCTLAALFTGIRGALFWIGGCRANYNVRVKLHRSLLLQEAAFFDTNETGYLLSRLNSDVNKIGQVISYHVNVVLRQSAQFIFGSMYLIKISPKLAMVTFAGISLVAWLSAVYGDLARSLAEKVQDTFADATAVAETSFSMSETIRAFDGAEIESRKFEAAQSKALELEEVQAWAYGTHKFLSDTLQSILQVGLLIPCWAIGRAGGLPAADLTTFMFYTGFVLESSNEVGDQWAKIQQAVGASSSVFDLIKRIPAIHDPPVTKITSTSASTTTAAVTPSSDQVETIAAQAVLNGSAAKNGVSINEGKSNEVDVVNGAIPLRPVIAVKNVTIEYAAMERPALTGVSTNVYPGDRVALVGRSGSGKSSMLRSMLRFYDPSIGSIELDGEDLRSLTRAETAAHVSLVEQEAHVFPLTLMENVLYGIDKDEIDSETGEAVYSVRYRNSVASCLKKVGLSVEPGNELGLELDTRIGEGGRSLSGGQRSRVAIARAIIRSPQVLLLDEPTAALDSESERLVIKSLQKAMEQTKSMVMVTHRLGVIRSLDVNRVIVLDRGEIVEEGNPEELLRDERSLYSALAKEQGITKLEPDSKLSTTDRH